MVTYPAWKYYPSAARPPGWVEPLLDVFRAAQDQVDSHLALGLSSNDVLKLVSPGLSALGFEIEVGKSRAEKIRRPVLYGEQGAEELAYEVDAFDPANGVALEIEAGRGVFGNAVYRDIIQTSLLIDARFLALAVMSQYRYRSGERVVTSPNYQTVRSIFDAIYASGRLRLPLEGTLLVGY